MSKVNTIYKVIILGNLEVSNFNFYIYICFFSDFIHEFQNIFLAILIRHEIYIHIPYFGFFFFNIYGVSK